MSALCEQEKPKRLLDSEMPRLSDRCKAKLLVRESSPVFKSAAIDPSFYGQGQRAAVRELN